MPLRPVLLVAALAPCSSAPDGGLGSNLIVNGGAELRVPHDAARPDGAADFEGWRRTGNVFFNRYAAFPSEHLGAAGDDFGEGRFVGGDSATSRLEQSIPVGTLADRVDAGAISYTIRGWLGSARQSASRNDQARVTARFLDERGGEIGSASLESPTDPEFKAAGTPFAPDGPITCVRREAGTTLPAGTRSIVVELAFTRRNGAILNASADNLELILTPAGSAAPAPPMAAEAVGVPAGGDADALVAGAAPLEAVEVRAFDDYGEEVLQVAFNPAGTGLAAAGRGGYVGSWDLRAGRLDGRMPIVDTPAEQHVIRGLGYGGVGNRLLAAASQTNKAGGKVCGVLSLWDLDARRAIRIRSLQARSFACASLQVGGPFAVAGLADGSVHAWDTTRIQVRPEARPAPGATVPDRLLTLAELLPLALGPPISAVAVQAGVPSPLAAAGGEDGSITILRLDASRGRVGRVGVLVTRKGAITGLAFSRDGGVLACSSAGGDVTLWDVRTGREIQSHSDPGAEARAVAFSPDGRLVAGGGADFKVRIWELRTPAEPDAPPEADRP